jgi:hypothetical protein
LGIGRYIKAAFLNHWNLLAFAAGTAFAFLTGQPDIALPLVAAAEIGYLGLLGTHPKFQKAVDAQAAKERRSLTDASSEEAFHRIRDGLPADYLARYEELRQRCLELRQIALDLRPLTASGSPAPLEKMQLAGLDRLLWIYLRLLHTSASLDRFFQRTSEDSIRGDIERLEKRLADFDADAANAKRKKARMALADNLETSRTRLENLTKAHQNHELIQLEIDRLSNKIQTLSELAVNRQEPDFIAGEVDAVATSMLETERTMNELQFATGLPKDDHVVPDLMTRAPESSEEEEPESWREKRSRRRRDRELEG